MYICMSKVNEIEINAKTMTAGVCMALVFVWFGVGRKGKGRERGVIW